MPRKQDQYQNIPLSLIDPCPLNPRVDKEGGVEDMSQSMDLIGVLHDPVVRPMGARYEVVVGDIRIATLKKRGEGYAVCKVRKMTDLEVEMAIAIENGIRRSLTDVEMGRLIGSHIKRVKKETGKRLTQTEIGATFGFSHRRIGLWLQAANLVDEVIPLVARPLVGKRTPKGKIPGRIASEIGSLPHEVQPEVAKQVAKEHLTRREAGKAIQTIKKKVVQKRNGKPEPVPSPPKVEEIVRDAIKEATTETKVTTQRPIMMVQAIFKTHQRSIEAVEEHLRQATGTTRMFTKYELISVKVVKDTGDNE